MLKEKCKQLNRSECVWTANQLVLLNSFSHMFLSSPVSLKWVSVKHWDCGDIVQVCFHSPSALIDTYHRHISLWPANDSGVILDNGWDFYLIEHVESSTPVCVYQNLKYIYFYPSLLMDTWSLILAEWKSLSQGLHVDCPLKLFPPLFFSASFPDLPQQCWADIHLKTKEKSSFWLKMTLRVHCSGMIV